MSSTYGQRFTLAARCLIGRASASGLRLDNERASAEHASIFWRENVWMVRDLGSRNGTTVDGRPVPAGERVALECNARIEFGTPDEAWRLVDVSPPTASARDVSTGEVRVAEDGLLALPDTDEVCVCVFVDSGGTWQVEDMRAAIVRVARDQEEIDIDGHVWVLQIPRAGDGDAVPTTRKRGKRPRSLRTMVLGFSVSRDQEQIELTLDDPEDRISLGARAHNELLLVLARRRLEDSERTDLSPAECGWIYVEDAARMLVCDVHHLNLLVHRARQHLGRSGVVDAGLLIERRLQSRQIRLGTDRVSITEY